MRNDALARACSRARELCRRYHTTYYVTHDSLDAPGEYHVIRADESDSPLDNRKIRYSAAWTGETVHNTFS